jgi:hypothetical protein
LKLKYSLSKFALMPNRTLFSDTDIMSNHWVSFPVESNKICIVMTGVFIVHLKGSSQSWLNQRIELSMAIPGLPGSTGIHLEQVAPYFGLNAIYNAQVANNSGHAVDSFGLASRENDPNFGQQGIVFFVDIAVRDSDAWLYRIGYNITIKGTYKPPRPF